MQNMVCAPSVLKRCHQISLYLRRERITTIQFPCPGKIGSSRRVRDMNRFLLAVHIYREKPTLDEKRSRLRIEITPSPSGITIRG
jgi:hypothetical protein